MASSGISRRRPSRSGTRSLIAVAARSGIKRETPRAALPREVAVSRPAPAHRSVAKHRQIRMASLIARMEAAEGGPKRRRETATLSPCRRVTHGRSTALPAPSTVSQRRGRRISRGHGGGQIPKGGGPCAARSGEAKTASAAAACGRTGSGRQPCIASYAAISGHGLARSKVCPSTASY